MHARTTMTTRTRFCCRTSASPVACSRFTKTGGLSCRRGGNLDFPRLMLPRTTLGSVHTPLVVCEAVEPSHAEKEANDKRWKEAGQQGSSKECLNWDQVTENIVVGSCPRSPQDLDTIAEEAGATALLSLQSDLCLEALNIDRQAIQDRGAEKGVAMIRVPIRDFDHEDQTLMLPEAVRTLAMLVASNHRVFVHCTAGINRATLTVLGYLTFVQGWELHSAVDFIKGKRPQAHPYIDCWKSTKARILQGRKDEVVALARILSKEANSKEGDSFVDWVEAENRLIQETFQRQLACSLAVVSSMAVSKPPAVSSACTMAEELEKAQEEITSVKKRLEFEQEDGSNSESCRAAFTELAQARDEIAALRQGLLEIGETSKRGLHDKMCPQTQAAQPTVEPELKTLCLTLVPQPVCRFTYSEC